MGALERYIVRSTSVAFLSGFAGITAVVWITQSLKSFDLITAQGQSFWTFLFVTSLGIPILAVAVAPIALFGAVLYVLNRLNADSELAVLSAAGVNPGRLIRPFASVALCVALFVGFLTASAVPASLRAVRGILTEIRADVVVNVLREGQFTRLDDNLTVHVRRREAGAALTGIMIDDSRIKGENTVYAAERGQVVKNEDGTYLLFEKGALQRKSEADPDATVVMFDHYAFDLSPLEEKEVVVTYKPYERYISELMNPPTKGKNVQRLQGMFRAELHERLVDPLYPLAFTLIALAALGRPSTTRQGRLGRIVMAVVIVFAVRLAGLGFVNLAETRAAAVPLMYAVPIVSGMVALLVVMGVADRFRGVFRAPRLAGA